MPNPDQTEQDDVLFPCKVDWDLSMLESAGI